MKKNRKHILKKLFVLMLTALLVFYPTGTALAVNGQSPHRWGIQESERGQSGAAVPDESKEVSQTDKSEESDERNETPKPNKPSEADKLDEIEQTVPEKEILPEADALQAQPSAMGEGDKSDGIVKYRALLVSADEEDSKLLYATKHDIISLDHALSSLQTPQGKDITDITRLHDMHSHAELENAIDSTYADADADDINIFYLSSHGGSYPDFGDSSFAHGYRASQLAAKLSQIPGTHLVIIMSCHSGGTIAKSMPMEQESFEQGVIEAFAEVQESRMGTQSVPPGGTMANSRFFVIASSSTLELSYGEGGSGNLNGPEESNHSDLPRETCKGLGMELPHSSVPWTGQSPPPSEVLADNNRDGVVTFYELKYYLRNQPFTNRTQTYPEKSEFPLFLYPENERKPSIYNIALSSLSTTAFALEFTMPDFSDDMRVIASYNKPGELTPTVDVLDVVKENDHYRVKWSGLGKNVRNTERIYFAIREESPFSSGYREVYEFRMGNYIEPTALPQITLSDSGNQPNVIIPGQQEYRILAEHNLDCLIDVEVYNNQNQLVRTLAKDNIAKRMAEGDGPVYNYNIYYWDGTDDNGYAVEPGTGYEVRVTPHNERGTGDTVTQVLPRVQAPQADEPLRIAQGGSTTLAKGKTLPLFCRPSYVPVTWESKNEDVATVSDLGKVTAKEVGTAEITVKAKNGERMATITVEVVSAHALTVNNGRDSDMYKPGQTVSIKAYTPPRGKRFKEWEFSHPVTFADGTDAKSNVAKFIMPAHALTATAVYEDIYAVTVNSGSGSDSYTPGETVSITANKPPTNHRFKEWEFSHPVTFIDGTDAKSPAAKFIMPAQALTATAIYEETAELVVMQSGGSGIYATGETVSLTAEPTEGRRFKEWIFPSDFTMIFVDGTDAQSTTVKFIMPEGMLYVIAAYEDLYVLTVNGGSGSESYKSGETVSITADEATDGQRFKEWEFSHRVFFVDGTYAASATAKFLMPTQALTVTAVYESLYALTVNGGSGSKGYKSGETVSITADEATDDQRFKEWEFSHPVTFVDGTNAKSTTAKFIMPPQPLTVTALYEAKDDNHLPVPTAAQFTISPTARTYNGSLQGVSVTPKTGVGKVTNVYYTGIGNTVYTKSKTQPVNVGTYNVTIDVAEGTQYLAQNDIDLGAFTIHPAKISDISASIAGSAVWTNSPIRPPLKSIKYSGKSLNDGIDFNISYDTNKDIGKGLVMLTGKGNFSGSKVISFRILPLRNAVSKVKVGKGRMTLKWSRPSRTAQGIDRYQIRYRKKGSSKWKTKSYMDSKASANIDKLDKGKKYEVQVRSGKKVLGVWYYSAWSKTKTSGKIR